MAGCRNQYPVPIKSSAQCRENACQESPEAAAECWGIKLLQVTKNAANCFENKAFYGAEVKEKSHTFISSKPK